jgi:hypothetical protein
MNSIATRQTMYDSIAGAKQLNNLPGFDPRRYLRKTVSETTGEEIYTLDLKYRKYWFAKICPAGRIQTTVLRITDQLATVEAKVYLNGAAAEPKATSIATRYAEGKFAKLYVERACDAAIADALFDAGFGIQFTDIGVENDVEPTGKERLPVKAANAAVAAHSVIPTVRAAPAVVKPQMNAPVAPAIMQQAPMQTAVAPIVPVAVASAIVPNEPVQSVTPVVITPAVVLSEPVQTIAPVEVAPAVIPNEPIQPAVPVVITPIIVQNEPIQQAAPVAEIPVVTIPKEEAQLSPPVAPTPEPAAEPEVAPVAAPRYTRNMSVDDILALMTPDEALAVVVDFGVCNGWTLAEVLEKRPASLKFFIKGYDGDNNIVRAGAKLLVETGAKVQAG